MLPRQSLSARFAVRGRKLPELARNVGVLVGLAVSGLCQQTHAANTRDHVQGLVENLRTAGEASFLHGDALLVWRLQQSYREGEKPCVAETYQHEEVRSTVSKAELLWNRHVRRTFSLVKIQRVTVKQRVKPNLYMSPLRTLSEMPDAYTITLMTGKADIGIEFHGFDGGPVVPKETPLSFMTYYHDLFVSSRRKAIEAAISLQALSIQCGAPGVILDDLTATSN